MFWRLAFAAGVAAATVCGARAGTFASSSSSRSFFLPKPNRLAKVLRFSVLTPACARRRARRRRRAAAHSRSASASCVAFHRLAVGRNVDGAAVREHLGELIVRHARPVRARCRCRYARTASRNTDSSRRRRAAAAGPALRTSSSGAPGMKKSIAWPTVCWLCCATPLAAATQHRVGRRRTVAADHMDRAFARRRRDGPPKRCRSACGSIVVSFLRRQSRRNQLSFFSASSS